jgi:hypothetical protein
MDDLVGKEFDWFAIDRNGAVALFATAGEGTVPQSVLSNTSNHNLIAEYLETPNWGSELVWTDLASYGLFVFDWNYFGLYIKVAAPSTALAKELRDKIINITEVPILDVDFNNIQELNIE